MIGRVRARGSRPCSLAFVHQARPAAILQTRREAHRFKLRRAGQIQLGCVQRQDFEAGFYGKHDVERGYCRRSELSAVGISRHTQPEAVGCEELRHLFGERAALFRFCEEDMKAT